MNREELLKEAKAFYKAQQEFFEAKFGEGCCEWVTCDGTKWSVSKEPTDDQYIRSYIISNILGIFWNEAGKVDYEQRKK